MLKLRSNYLVEATRRKIYFSLRYSFGLYFWVTGTLHNTLKPQGRGTK